MASTQTGSVFKVALGAFLMYVLDSMSEWNIPAWLLIVGTAVVPVLINELNPKDHRYGLGSDE